MLQSPHTSQYTQFVAVHYYNQFFTLFIHLTTGKQAIDKVDVAITTATTDEATYTPHINSLYFAIENDVDNGQSIAAVAEESGIGNVRTLQRRMQEVVGMTPVDYRRMLTRDQY